MWKFKKKKRILDGKSSFEDSLIKSKRGIYRVIFAVAMAIGVTPKKLVSNLNEEKQTDYANKVTKEIKKKGEKDLAKKLKI